MYTPLSNWRYDSGPHQLQSGPSHEGFIVSSSGIQDTGADLGVITAGSPNDGAWALSTSWRTVPPAVSGFWTDFSETYIGPSGAITVYNGYRPLGVTTIANAKVSTAFGPQYGVRATSTSTYFNGVAPSFQLYNPYNTPDNNSVAEGYTGGGVSHGRYTGGILTNPTNDTSGSRAAWIYNPPVYCQTFTETRQSPIPGSMGATLRYIYRGRSSSYVYNYGSIYYQGAEGVRNMLRRFSPTVNSSNQK